MRSVRHRRAATGDEGFTLIELLVVIIIIGILAAIAIPVFLNQRQKARDAAAKSDLQGLSVAMETFRTDHPAYPASLADLDNNGLTPKTSPSTFVAILNSDADGYCLAASNSQSTPSPGQYLGTVVYYWDSGQGGLKSQSQACPSYPGGPSLFLIWPH